MKYKISVFGPGIIGGYGFITKKQFQFWTDPENDLSLYEIANGDHPISIDVPSEAIIEFFDLYEEPNLHGIYQDECNIHIEAEDGEIIFSGTLDEYDEHFDPDRGDIEFKHTDSSELPPIPKNDFLLTWYEPIEGTFFHKELELDKFDPLNLVITNKSDGIWGRGDVIIAVSYDNRTIFEFDWDSSHDFRFELKSGKS